VIRFGLSITTRSPSEGEKSDIKSSSERSLSLRALKGAVSQLEGDGGTWASRERGESIEGLSGAGGVIGSGWELGFGMGGMKVSPRPWPRFGLGGLCELEMSDARCTARGTLSSSSSSSEKDM